MGVFSLPLPHSVEPRDPDLAGWSTRASISGTTAVSLAQVLFVWLSQDEVPGQSDLTQIWGSSTQPALLPTGILGSQAEQQLDPICCRTQLWASLSLIFLLPVLLRPSVRAHPLSLQSQWDHPTQCGNPSPASVTSPEPHAMAILVPSHQIGKLEEKPSIVPDDQSPLFD